jgi:hypothetical protein
MAQGDRDSGKIPIWFGNGKDLFTAEHWIKRLENAKVTNGWTDAQLVNHAHSALRDKALQFRDYLERENLGPNEWESFRAHFLQQFGSTTVDHSKATNLSVTQKTDEKVTMFAWRVSTVVDEFFSSVPQGTLDTSDPVITSLPDQILAHLDTVEARSLVTEWGKAVAKYVHINFSKGVNSSLARAVFLNGIHPNIRAITKLKETTTLHEAVMAAMKAEKAYAGPTDRSVNAIKEAFPEADTEDEEKEVHFVQKRRSGKPTTGFRRKTNAECWYCHKKNHIQLNCRLRLSRGAALVQKPRTVQEIQIDRIAYQLGPDEDPESKEASDNEVGTEIASLSFNHLN